MTTKAIKVLYSGGARTATFDSKADAIEFGRLRSRSDGKVEVSDHLGMIAVFESGKATPDFARVDAGYTAPHVPATYDDLLATVRTTFAERLGALPRDQRTEERLYELVDGVVTGAIPIFNDAVIEILASDLTIGFPSERSVMEAGDIFEALRASIRESLMGDTHKEVEAALTVEEDA